VADTYDALISDRPYRKAMAPWEARNMIEKGTGKDFDPKVVDAFLKAWARGEMELPPGWWTNMPGPRTDADVLTQ
jgi:HD-GYP domain-containing protein (c-di-GMP phosphodiesterase class II)